MLRILGVLTVLLLLLLVVSCEPRSSVCEKYKSDDYDYLLCMGS